MNFGFFTNRLPLFLLLQLYASGANAQVNEEFRTKLVAVKPEMTKDFHPFFYSSDDNYLFLHMGFNAAIFTERYRKDFFADKTIEEIWLIYTHYKLAEDFNQPKLNSERIDSLMKVIPNLQSQSWINWRFIAQTNADNEEDAKKLFHGFIIKFKPMLSTGEELKEMKELLSSDSFGKEICDTVRKAKLGHRMKKTGKWIPVDYEKQKMGIVYDSKGIANRQPQFAPKIDTMWTFDTVCGYKPKPDVPEWFKIKPDNPVFNSLERNIKNWGDVVVVADVTGSMHQYNVQLLIWNRLNQGSKINSFAFFNDGDMKPESEKKIGETGGIYTVKTNSYSKVEEAIYKTMYKGNGGSAPENDLEAIIYSFSVFPNCTEVILIADNTSLVKDFVLLKYVTKPVHVILCGTKGGINTQYLDLARFTKGSVHTNEQDYYFTGEIKENDIIKIDGFSYILLQGKFARMME